MLKKALVALSLTVASCMPTAPAMAGEPFQIDTNAVALTICRDAKGEGVVGTGFWISPTRFITAQHVTEGRRCTVLGKPAKTVIEDRANDIAELSTEPQQHALSIDCATGFRPNKIYLAIGYPGGEFFTRVPVLATNLRSYDTEANGLNVFVGHIAPGMSGGPAVDDTGTVVGINNRYLPVRLRALKETFVCKFQGFKPLS